MTTTPPKTVSLHLPQNVISIKEQLNGLVVDHLVSVAVQHGVSRHNHLGLSLNRTSVLISGQTQYLVARFADFHGLSDGNALDILVWSGFQYKHGVNLEPFPSVVEVSDVNHPRMLDANLRIAGVKGRPKTGQGRVCDLRLPEKLDFRIRGYGSRYAELVRELMLSYVDNPVPFMDCSGVMISPFSSTPLRVSLLPWQVELLKEIEFAFGCTRSQALLKILVAIGEI